MRTNIDIDSDLIAEAMAATGEATVEAASRLPARRHQLRAAAADSTGLEWDGDLDAMREGRHTAQSS
jgi:Arc/MetJ family transcription regulator